MPACARRACCSSATPRISPTTATCSSWSARRRTAGRADMEALPAIQPDALEVLRRRPRREHEASFFFVPAFQRASVKVLPGEYFVHDQDVSITTTLGSCVAACLHDRTAGIGGINHFMLPDGGDADDAAAGGRFGAFAMELLI